MFLEKLVTNNTQNDLIHMVQVTSREGTRPVGGTFVERLEICCNLPMAGEHLLPNLSNNQQNCFISGFPVLLEQNIKYGGH